MAGEDAIEVDEALNRLYGLPLESFIPERDDLAKRLRRAGDKEAAAEVKALRKPTRPAWALNQLSRRRSDDVGRLVQAGAALAAAQAGGDPGSELRAAAAAFRAVADELAADAPIEGEAALERVQATLRATAGDEELRDELASGRVTQDRPAVGFGVLPEATVGKPAPAPEPKAQKAPKPRQRKRDDAAERKRERERAARRKAAEKAVAAAEKRVEEAQALVEEAQADLEAARVTLDAID